MFNSSNTWRRMTRLLFAIVLPMSFIFHAHAQRALITRPVDDSVRVSLRGNVHPLAQAANDLGPVSDSETTGTLLLVLGRSAEQQAALDAFAKSASMPGSVPYRNWVTPQAFAKQFGASQSDIAQITSWLEANGFKVEKVANAGNVIRFSGNMGALRSAFRTEIHRYQVGESVHLSNSIDPSVPAALAPVIRGIVALNDFRPKSQAIRGPHATHTAQGQDSNRPRSQLTVYGPTQWGQPLAGSPNYDVYFLPGAGDAAVIYDTPNSAMNPAYKGTTWTGAGVTIGIAADSNLSAAAIGDIANYRSLFLNEPL
ncbi:MAG: protease pro-enzyme activation domain-containing protein, partial [Terracidiphilus sp.]